MRRHSATRGSIEIGRNGKTERRTQNAERRTQNAERRTQNAEKQKPGSGAGFLFWRSAHRSLARGHRRIWLRG
ncbi:hypothetical protein F5D26_01905 [Burkholderia pseudomallei]|nr:hypothetical protein F5D26_01905 [Burkholderia pseudomallei]